ncbi:hypothetical protein IMSAGC022_00510 [Alistipes sp.]|nr:hypothetical protein IMSAGC022_00510 [Alistipes sp.]
MSSIGSGHICCTIFMARGPCTASWAVFEEPFSNSSPSRRPNASPSRHICSQSLASLAALTHSMYFSSVKRYTSTSSTMPPLPLGMHEYCTLPSTSLATLLVVMRCKNSQARGPLTQISPMWLTSNTPAFSRTVMCSSLMPENSIGML